TSPRLRDGSDWSCFLSASCGRPSYNHPALHSIPPRRSSDLTTAHGGFRPVTPQGKPLAAARPKPAGKASKVAARSGGNGGKLRTDRKSTRLNSSHEWSSYAVFCLKKKTNECTR